MIYDPALLRGTKADFPWRIKPAIKCGLDIAPNSKLSPRLGESTPSRVFNLLMSHGAGRRRGWRTFLLAVLGWMCIRSQSKSVCAESNRTVVCTVRHATGE